MASTLRGYTPGVKLSSGKGTIAWPTGTEAGDLAFLFCHDGSYLDVDNEPTGSGWSYHGGQGWSKRVTTADLANPVSVSGMTIFLATFTGAGKVGNVGKGAHGCKMSVAGSGLIVVGTGGDLDLGALTPATGKLGSDLVSHPHNSHLHAMWWLPQTTTGYKQISPTQDVNYDAFEIVPGVGPSAPTPLSPISAVQVDRAVDLLLKWRHNSSQSEGQDAYQARIRQVSTSTWYYVLADGTLSVTETTITDADPFASIDGGTLTADTVYEWQSRTQELGTWSPWSTSAQVTAVVAPTVDTVTVTAAFGDLSPSITATVTIASGTQTARQVRVKQGSTVLWDSGIVRTTSLTAVVPAQDDWTNGASLTAEWRVCQTGGIWSAWVASAAFAVEWTPPTAPSSVTAANQAHGPLRVTVAGITTSYDRLQVQSSTDNFTTAKTIADFDPDTTTEIVDVPEALYGVATKYRARVADYVEGVLLWSAWTTIAAAVASSDMGAYLISDDGVTVLAVRISEELRWRAQGVSVHYPMGADYPRVDRAKAAGWAGSCKVLTDTQAEASALVNFLDNNPTFRVRWNPERVGSTVTPVPTLRVAWSSAVEPERLAQAAIQHRRLPIDWVEQGAL